MACMQVNRWGTIELMAASWEGQLERVMELLTAGAKPDTQDPVCTHCHIHIQLSPFYDPRIVDLQSQPPSY